MELTPLADFGVRMVRPGMLVATAPGIGGVAVPPLVKIGLTAVLVLFMLPVNEARTPGTDNIVLVIAREAAIGLALAMAGRLVIAAAEAAGALVGMQIGFSYATVVDPQSSARNNLLASLYGLIATLTFFAIDGHHALLRALAASYSTLPIGTGAVNASLVATVGGMASVIFSVAVQIAAPLIVALFIAEVVLGMISRAAPQLNLASLSFTIRAALGLFILAQVIGFIPDVLRRYATEALSSALALASALR